MNSVSTNVQIQRSLHILICNSDLLYITPPAIQVGTEYSRGVSGGEKKRTDIGMELIIEPNILFLDEPTTGLDAFTARATIRLLKKYKNLVKKIFKIPPYHNSLLHCLVSYSLCTGGRRIIIMSIHQPRYSIYREIDSLTLLSKGNMVFHGETANCLGYFAKLG